MRAINPDVENEMEKIHYVVGKIEGPLDIRDDEKVLFAGDCTSWKGRIGNKQVSIKSTYKSARQIDEKKAPSNDLLLKTLQTLWNRIKNINSRYMRAKGCTVSVGDHVHYLSMLAKSSNPNFDSRLVFSVNHAYWVMRIKRFINRFSG
jgi:hypothetical protein